MADKSTSRARTSTGRAVSVTGTRRPATGSRAPKGSSRGPAKGSAGSAWKRAGLVVVIAVLLAAIVAAVGVIVFYNRTTLPDPNKDFTTNTTFLYYEDGTSKLGSFAVQNRQSLPYAQMPADIKDAVVSAENRTFWTDRGISPSGIVRSAWTIARGGEVQGGSTITQQYIKVLYLSQDRTMTRKMRELALAVKMGKQLPKEQILQGYLNTVYFGRGAYGVQAASRSYFNVDAAKLTVPQAAVLASVLNNPSIYDPSVAKGNSQRLLDRYRYVLDGMKQAGKITATQEAQYAKALPPFPDIPLNQRWSGTNGYLLKMVMNELVNKGFSQSQIEGGGLKITTTFDQKLEDRAIEVGQKYAKRVGSNYDDRTGKASGTGSKLIHPTIASVRVGTGEVLAVYGGDDYIKNSRNWATTDRPAASTFKAWATVAALRGGLSLRSVLNGDTFTPDGDKVSIRNENNEQYGAVSLRTALAKSINTAFVDAVTSIKHGPQATIKAANDAGVPKGAGWDANDRIPLGIAEVNPVENANGYATFANEGVAVPQHVVKKVVDASGKVLYTAPTSGKQTIEKDVADDVSNALESVTSSEGTGARAADLGYPVAGKTGTNGVERNGNNVITSAWFVAYTKQISTAIMYVAGDDGNGSLDEFRRDGDSAFFGATYPAMTWVDFMTTAVDGLPQESLPDAAGVNRGSDSEGEVYAPPATHEATWSNDRSTGTSGGNGNGGSDTGQSQATATAQATQQATQRATAQATSRATATQAQATTRVTQAQRTATSRSNGNGNGTSNGNSGSGTSNGNGNAGSGTRNGSGTGNGNTGSGTSNGNGNANGKAATAPAAQPTSGRS